MRRLVAALLASGVCVSPALGQAPFGFPPGVFTGRGALDASGSAPTYTGPGDVVSGAFMYGGLWAYSAATRGNRALNVCNVSDIVCSDVSSDPTTGIVTNDPTIGGVLCGTSVGVNLCTVKTIYDQSGNGRDWSQATIASRATFTPNGVSAGLASLTCNGSQYEQTGTVTSLTTPYTFVLGGLIISASGNTRFVSDTGDADIVAGTGPVWGVYGGSAVVSSATVSLSTFYRVIGHVASAGTGAIVVNNVSVSGSPGNTAPGTQISVCATPGGGTPATGQFEEVGVWPIEFSTGQVTSMDSNIHTRTGF